MKMHGWLRLMAAGTVFCGAMAVGARGDTGQDASLEEHARAVEAVTAEEWAEALSPEHGGGNWAEALMHRGEADGWEGDVDLKGWFGRKKAAKPLPKGTDTMGKVVCIC